MAQIAFSLMLLAAAFLMSRGFRHSLEEDGGFAEGAREHVLLVRFDPRLVQYDASQIRSFYELLAERLRETPGVQSASFSQTPPLGLDDFDRIAFVPEGFTMPRDQESFTAWTDTVDRGFFETMGVSILRGRAFSATDTADSPRVAVVNEQFARHYWPGGDAVGKRFRIPNAGGASVEIVGVAQTIKYRETFGKRPDVVYLALAQHPVARMVLLVRSTGDPLPLVEAVKRVARGLDANMPLLETRTYAELYRYSAVEGPGIAIKLVGTLGAVGFFLAIAGLYGIVAYNVSRRTHEIGIRIAIGARPRDVTRLVMGKGLRLVAVGTAIGLVLGVALERLMNAMLFNAGGTDLLVYAVVVPTMILVTMLAAWVPARKAARIAPTIALRYE